MFTYREFNSLTDFTEVLNDILKEYSKEYNEFLKIAQNDENAKFVIYEDFNRRIHAFPIPDCSDIDDFGDIFKRDRIITIIDADIQITHYRIKKAEL